MARKTYDMLGEKMNKTQILGYMKSVKDAGACPRDIVKDSPDFIKLMSLVKWHWWHRRNADKIECFHVKNTYTRGRWLRSLGYLFEDRIFKVIGITLFLDSEEDHNKKEAAAAFRYLIGGQALEYKKQYFQGNDWAICEYTGKEMRWENCHVDHEVKYSSIFSEFVAAKRMDLGSVLYKHNESKVDGSFRLEDKALAKEWVEFHRKRFKPRCVLASVNLSELNKKKDK